MTRHNEPDWIGAIRHTNSPHGLRASNLLGKFSVRERRTAGDLAQFIPDATLKCRSRRLHRDLVDRFDVTREVTVDRIPKSVRIVSRFEIESILAVVQAQKA